MKTAARWIAVLPAALGGYIAAVLAITLLFAITPNDSAYIWIGGLLGWLFGLPTDSREFSVEVVSSYFRAWAFVYAGARVAPSHRVQTALVLGTTMIAVMTFGLGLFAQALLRVVDMGYWRLALYALFSLALYVGGVIHAVRSTQTDVRENAWMQPVARPA